MIETIDLTLSPWKFRLSTEKPELPAGFNDTIALPSTVSQMKKPPLTDERNSYFLTDPYRFSGYALYEKSVNLAEYVSSESFEPAQTVDLSILDSIFE